VVAQIKAKIATAKLRIPARSFPTNGIQDKSLMIGVKSR
jgi:hypothetical protein